MTKIRLDFTIWTEKKWQPQIMDSFFNLNPGEAKIEIKGTAGRYVSNLKENSWTFSTGYITSDNVQPLSEILINKLANQKKNIHKYLIKKGLEAKLYIVIETKKDNIPLFVIDRKLLLFLESFNSTVNMDLYIY